MASKIILKKSSVPSKVPGAADLDYGELALNYTDGILYYKNSDTNIRVLVNSAQTAVTSVDGNTGAISPEQLITAVEKVDGTGSGLDADLLDGHHGSITNTASTVVVRDVNSFVNLSGITFTTDIGTSTMQWNATEGTHDVTLYNNTTLQLGQEIHVFAKADAAIANGQVVMFAGAQGSHILVVPADSTSPIMQAINGNAIVGIATQDIAVGNFGYITWFGNVSDLDTTAWAPGTILYFDPDVPGALTPTVPVAPKHKIMLAAVLRQHAENGRILVRPTIFQHLSELSDVSITTIANHDVLQYNGTNQRWENTQNLVLGGTISHTGLVATEGTSVDQTKTLTRQITLTTDWQDVGISGTDLATGTYIIQLYANDVGSGGTNNNEYYSGTMSWYSGATNSSYELPTDEIVLHRAGGSGDGALYLRTYRTPNGLLKLQIYSNNANASSSNYNFKFRRMI